MQIFQMKFFTKFLYFVGLYFTITICFPIAATAAVVEARAGGSGNEQSTSRRAQISRAGRNSRVLIPQPYYKRQQTRIRYSSVVPARNRGKSSYARPVSTRNTTYASSDGRNTGRYNHYSLAQKSFYNMRSINKHYRIMRLEHRRYSREIERTKTEMNQLRQKCNAYERNATGMALNFERQKKEFHNYQKETMSKIRQIETHQQSQDLRYFGVFEATSNNTAEISQLQSRMDNLNEMYGDGDIGDIILNPMPVEDNWNQQLSAQQDGPLRYEEFTVDDETAEEIIERSYQRVTDNVLPRLDNHNDRLHAMQESLQRQNKKLANTNSAVNEFNSALEASLSVQNDLTKRMSDLNQTMKAFNGDLESTKTRVSIIEEQNQNQKLAFYNLKLAISQINSSLPRRSRIPAPLIASAEHQQFGYVEAQILHERIEQVSNTLQQERRKVANLSRAVQSLEGEIRYLTMATSNFYAILTKQATVIHQQNVTMTPVLAKMKQQDHQIMDLENSLSYYHETVMKLLNIVTNLGQQIRRPIPPHKDCHDLWMSGHTENGVYTVMHEMKSKQLFCNMTVNGGWTVIQRRNDGSQDFDLSFHDYRNGFGNIYSEFWIGLDSLRWLTNGRIYTLMVILEDWGGNRRYAFYDQFCVYGHDYALKVTGYNGDAGDSLSLCNQQTFKVRPSVSNGIRSASSDCTATHKSGWWFPQSCGVANPNGPYSRMANESVNFDDIDDNPSTTQEIRYMAWRGDDFPLKKILMQIAPRETINEEIFELFSSDGRNKDEDTAANNIERLPPPFEVINSSSGRQ